MQYYSIYRVWDLQKQFSIGKNIYFLGLGKYVENNRKATRLEILQYCRNIKLLFERLDLTILQYWQLTQNEVNATN